MNLQPKSKKTKPSIRSLLYKNELIVLGIVLALLAAMMIYGGFVIISTMEAADAHITFNQLFPMIIMVSAAIAIASFYYMNRNEQKTRSTDAVLGNSEFLFDSDHVKFLENQSLFLHQMSSHIDKLEDIISGAGITEVDISPDEKRELLTQISARISDDLAEKLMLTAHDHYNKGQNSYFINRLVIGQISETKDRITSEIASLKIRGAINLSIGVFTTLIAVFLLGSLVFFPNYDFSSTEERLWDYIPRVSLALLIEVFSFFFLRLYRGSLTDIKYFQNEQTTLDAKIIALGTSITLGKEESVANIIDKLSQLDRNSRLAKGESTVDLEILKHDKEELRDLLTTFKEVFASSRRPNE